MSEDFLGLSDDEERARQRTPAFVTSPPFGQAELKAAEHMHLDAQRNKKFAGAAEVIFTVEEDGVEMLLEEEAVKWRALMGWPDTVRLPTLEEIEQFRRARSNNLHVAHWERLRAAVITDEADAADAEARKTAAIVKSIRK